MKPVSVRWFNKVEPCIIIHMSLYVLSNITAWTKGQPLLTALRNSGRFWPFPLLCQTTYLISPIPIASSAKKLEHLSWPTTLFTSLQQLPYPLAQALKCCMYLYHYHSLHQWPPWQSSCSEDQTATWAELHDSHTFFCNHQLRLKNCNIPHLRRFHPVLLLTSPVPTQRSRPLTYALCFPALPKLRVYYCTIWVQRSNPKNPLVLLVSKLR